MSNQKKRTFIKIYLPTTYGFGTDKGFWLQKGKLSDYIFMPIKTLVECILRHSNIELFQKEFKDQASRIRKCNCQCHPYKLFPFQSERNKETCQHCKGLEQTFGG